MADSELNAASHLSETHSTSSAVEQEWDQDNQQWWDWYMSLADNDEGLTDGDLIDVDPPEETQLLTMDELRQQLSLPYRLTAQQKQDFQKHSFIKLKHVLSPTALGMLRSHLELLFDRAGDALGSSFGSLEMMWEQDSIIREFVMSERLARIAAELLDVTAIRLYHDNGLSKQPGCGRTPWHYDDHHFPIATNNVCTVWIPVQPIPMPMGPLEFARGMEVYQAVKDIPFNKFDNSYDRRVKERLLDRGISVEASPFELGEVSFHHNLNFHTAGPNRTSSPRMVLATTYFEDGAKVIDAPHMVNGDWRKFIPNTEPGEVIDTPLNPVLYADRP